VRADEAVCQSHICTPLFFGNKHLEAKPRKGARLLKSSKATALLSALTKRPVPSETIAFDGYFSTANSFVTENTPGTEFARALARILSASFATTPTSVT
jgi:hypothetical protein